MGCGDVRQNAFQNVIYYSKVKTTLFNHLGLKLTRCRIPQTCNFNWLMQPEIQSDNVTLLNYQY